MKYEIIVLKDSPLHLINSFTIYKYQRLYAWIIDINKYDYHFENF